MREVTAVTREEAQEIVSALRAGVVPRLGLHHFATGLDRLMDAVAGELGEVAAGRGQGKAKWIRGDYGSGKTFATRLLCSRARERRFATAEVQVSINDTPLHHLETVYRRMMERLTTSVDGVGAFRAIVDTWLFELGEEVTRLKGINEDDPEFPRALEARLEDKLAEFGTQDAAFAQVLRAYRLALEASDYRLGQGLLAWLAGQPSIDRSITSRAGVKGAVDGQTALTFLRGVLLLLRQCGYAGLVLVLDEVETVQRMPPPTRDKSFVALRQLVDMLANGDLPGLLLVVTGTPAFFDDYKGLKSAPALYQRVATRFDKDPAFDNLLAPQVRLPAFDQARLLEVGHKVRDLYPAKAPDRVAAKGNDSFLQALAAKVSTGFGGRVSVCPRVFLRELVDVLDKIDQHPDYDPVQQYELAMDEHALTPEELDAYRSARGAASASGVEDPKAGDEGGGDTRSVPSPKQRLEE